MSKTVRIAGVQGFYGDSPMGAIMVAAHKAADYLMHDALAELTLSILQKDKLKDPSLGYARDIEFHAAKLYPITLANGIKVVTDSGGLNPHSAAQKVKAILAKQGITDVKIAAIDGDDMFDRLDELKASDLPFKNMDSGQDYRAVDLKPTHANVYVGAQKVKEALDQGAQIILAGRVADPCLALGILAHEYGWKLEGEDLEQADLDKMANGIMIGHILECGGQASGGNAYSEWNNRDYKFSNLGYPIAHVEADGSATITKLADSGGKVSRNTVREQLVYEIHDPSSYITPDVTVDLTNIIVEEIGKDQVRVSGAKGKARPEMLKLCIGQMEGFLTEQLFFFSYPYAYDKAKAFIEAAQEIWAGLPFQAEEVRINYLGINGIHDKAAPELPKEYLDNLNEIGVRLAIRHNDRKVGKLMIQSIICLGLNGPPGIAASINWGKAGSIRLGMFPTLIPRSLVEVKVTMY
ncbi:MAG: DUF1446 domain-containing protein [Aureispira sp.]|nr:DUF1446 domain-containing protein [Aureispira sp.]